MDPNVGPLELLVAAANGGGTDPKAFAEADGAALGAEAPNGFAPLGGFVPEEEGAAGFEELLPKTKG